MRVLGMIFRITMISHIDAPVNSTISKFIKQDTRLKTVFDNCKYVLFLTTYPSIRFYFKTKIAKI